MAAAESSPLSTHVLNTADGLPAAQLSLSLHRLDSNMMIWNLMSVGCVVNTWKHMKVSLRTQELDYESFHYLSLLVKVLRSVPRS